MPDEVDAALDRLYGVPLDEFVAERKAIAAELRAAGRREGASLVAKAAKPSVSTWAINQLARRNRRAVDELLGAGESLVREQAAALRGDGEGFEQAQRAERSAVRRLVDAAAKILDVAGRPPSATVRERIAATLRAAAVDDEGRALLAKGRLTRDLEPAGFDALAAMAATPGRGGGRRRAPAPTARPRREQPKADERRARLAEAREALSAARRLARERERAARDADRQARAAEKAARDAEQEAERARGEAEEARRRAAAAASAAGEAAADLTNAESALAAARR